MEVSIKNSISEITPEKIDISVNIKEYDKPKFQLVSFKSSNLLDLVVKFTLEKDESIIDFNFYHIEKVNFIFYRFLNQWGIIDWKLRKLNRKVFNGSIDFPFFYLHKECILIVDDLFAETIDFNGNLIDEIANEQPHEIIEYEDYFEFDILGVEKRKLNKKLLPTINKNNNGKLPNQSWFNKTKFAKFFKFYFSISDCGKIQKISLIL